ncbi:tissue-type plasminogen activator isoform X1 [Rhinoderma darwinii]|uniref:tissue-type plasminogen activator isoform X1 n=1 Tax=Rhinoderma darwinii TaxID=43563 RepID=UPI003F6789A9
MQKIETCLLGYRAMTIFLIFLLGEVLSSTQEVLHRREKRGTRAYKSVCVEKPSGRIYTAGDTWMRPAGRRVEFCRCEEGRRRCHSVPFIECAETKCYNGGRCLQALYSPNYLCKCLSRFTGEHCEIDNLASCYEGSGQSYRGNYSRTNSGAVCVNWNTQALNQKMYHAQCRDAQQLGLGNHNYCRNPDGDNSPWCYIFKNGKYSWDHCSVPACQAKTTDCHSERGTSYRGLWSTTISGASCLRWDSSLLKRKQFSAWQSSARRLGLGSHNYCRNPDNDVRPWCHVMNGTETSWELCKVPQCTNCGIRQPQLNSRFRIAAGRIAHITSHPWMAAIFRVSRGTEYFRCGGTLISPCWVVTAAHCFYEESFPNRLRVKLGRTLQIVPGKEEQSFTVERLYIHPQFNDSNFDNDIALLNLKSSSESCAMDTDSARPACMPVRDQTLPDWTECEISGFGKHTRNSPFHSKQLKDGRVRLYPAKLCTSKQLANRTVTANMLCAGDPVNQDDACQGDSGGPLVCPINGLMHLLGVISWGEDCGVKDKPGVYTRVTRYIDWIQQKTGIQLN